MKMAWAVYIHAVFDGNRRLDGGDFRTFPHEDVVIDGAPVGLPELSFAEFAARARNHGLHRLSLMVSDATGPDRARSGYRDDHGFVLVGDPIGSWCLEQVVYGAGVWAYRVCEPPTIRQFGIDEATDRLRVVLDAGRQHPTDGYRDSALQGIEILDGAPPPRASLVEPYGMSASGTRLYNAAMEIGGHKIEGMGGFSDLPLAVGPSEVVYAVAQAIATSTRSGIATRHV